MPTGIISAMSEEIDLLIEQMEVLKEISAGGRTYFSGVFQNTEIVAVFSRMGKVASAITATDLLNKFDLDAIIFVGVAGAVDDFLNIGDIVVGDKLYQHDMNAFPIFKEFEIPLTGQTTFSTNHTIRKRLQKASERLADNFNEIISDKTIQDFSLTNPKVVKGTIASGDQFINSAAKRDALKSKIPDLLCVEMEGAAVAQVCYEYEIPFGILRVISDSANEDAHIDFQKFVSKVASRYSLSILEAYFEMEYNSEN